MRKIISFLIAMALFLCIAVGYGVHVDREVDGKAAVLKNYKTNATLNSKRFLAAQLDENTLPVLGSSELDDIDGLEVTSYPLTLFNRSGSDFKVLLSGRGNTQSLFHAIGVAALADSVKCKKVVLIISPQWFAAGGITSEAFCAKFSPQLYSAAMASKGLAPDIKKRIAARTAELLSADPSTRRSMGICNDVYLYGSINPVKHISQSLSNSFMQLKSSFDVLKETKDYPPYEVTGSVKADDINFDELLMQSQANGAKHCTNNSFGVNDDYFNTYIVDKLAELKGSMSTESYSQSPEYDDLQLFVDVCKSTGIEPLLVSVPMNASWYDYCGFTKEKREEYYENIRALAQKNDVTLADFSNEEYTSYFLRDIMHLGWKGWASIDQEIYGFYQQNQTK